MFGIVICHTSVIISSFRCQYHSRITVERVTDSVSLVDGVNEYYCHSVTNVTHILFTLFLSVVCACTYVI